MSKYKKEHLAELVKGAFATSVNEPAFYGSENGTFLNTDQYSRLTDEDKQEFHKFENPSLVKEEELSEDTEEEKAALEAKEAEAKAKAEAAAAKKAEAAAKKAAK
jgi:uncharacterized membrane protein YqiK